MIAIVNSLVEPVTGPRIEGASVLIDKGRIKAVGKRVSIPAGARRIDAGGCLLTPGLIDAHSHAGLREDGLVADVDVNEQSETVTPRVRALDAFRPTDAALLEAAQSGVTSIFVTPGSTNVMGGMGAFVKTVAPSFREQIVKEDAGLKMATGENPKVYGGDRMPVSRMGVAAVMRDVFTRAGEYVGKKKAHAAKRGATKGPFEHDNNLEAVCGLLEGRYPARCHAHRSVDMLMIMRMAEEFNFGVVFEHATECEEIMPEIVARNIPVVIGPSLGSRSKTEVIYKSFGTVAAAVKAGLLVAITADHGVTPLRYLNVYAALAIREGVPRDEALKCITINPAKICGVDQRLGSIEPGKDADLVLWESDPFDVCSRPALVWIEGREVDLSVRHYRRFSPFSTDAASGGK